MIEVKANMKSLYKANLSCLGCKQKDSEEDQTHVMNCVAYEDLRKDMNFSEDRDLIKYFQEVLKRREKLMQKS